MKKFLSRAFAFITAALVTVTSVYAAEGEAQPRSAVVETFAGTGLGGYADGRNASFRLPSAISESGANILVADTYNNLIRAINKNGRTDTLTGDVLSVDDYRFPKGFYLDGTKSRALFNRPSGIATNAAGRSYIADSANHVIRVISGNAVSTFAGGAQGYANGKSDEAQFNTPSGIALDGKGNLYVADTLNHVIRKIDAKGNVTTAAGVPGDPGLEDSTAMRAKFNSPMGVAVTDDGQEIYIADTGNHRIRKISDGRVTTVAGTTTQTDADGEPWGDFADGLNAEAMFNLPIGIVIYEGNLMVADSGNNRIRLVTETEVATLAGSGEPGAADGALQEATFNLPSGLYVKDDVLYVADTANNLVRKINLKFLKD